MILPFSFGDVEQKWIDGPFPLKRSGNRRVKVQLTGKTSSYFPSAINKIGDLLASERPTPLQHAITLLLSFPYSTVPLGGPPAKEGEWADVPGSVIYRQIRIPLPREAISQIREVENEAYSYELTLEDVQLELRPLVRSKGK
ncbi:MAG: hypothetical protein ABI233_04545 [Chthoniobacterales bacterium]